MPSVGQSYAADPRSMIWLKRSVTDTRILANPNPQSAFASSSLDAHKTSTL